jgi:hypothetical protein
VAVERQVGVADEALADGVAPFQAVEVGADPQVVAGVVVEGQDAGVAHAFIGADVAPLRLAVAGAPGVEAGGGADPQDPALPHRQRHHGVALGAAVRVDVVVVEAARAGRQVVDAAPGADPQAAAPVRRQCGDAVVAQAAGVAAVMPEGAEASAGDVEMDQAVAGADPQAAGAIADDGGDRAVARHPLGGGREGIAHELLGGLVEARQAAARAEPQSPFAVFPGCLYIVVRQRGGIARVAAEDAHLVAVVAVQSVLGAEPHESGPVLQDGLDRFLRQPLFQAHVFEAQAARRAGLRRHAGNTDQDTGRSSGRRAQQGEEDAQHRGFPEYSL